MLLQHDQLLLLLLLLLQHQLSSLKEPLGITHYLVGSDSLSYTTLISIVLSLFQLTFIHLLVHPMHLTHLFDFIEVHNKTALISMVFLDALSAEDRQMIRTIEVLHPLIMLVAQ